MKPLFKTFLIALPLLALAVGVSAYSNPTAAYPTDTPVVPVTTGAANQVKTGGLGVGVFTASGDSLFTNTIFISGVVRGGDVTKTNSTVYFGDSANKVGVDIENVADAANASASLGTLTTDALSTARAGGSGLRKTCSNGGTIVLCN